MQAEHTKQKIRFAVVGIANTTIDFGLFLVLSLGGTPAIAANYISTTTGMTFSFFANKKYTFRAHGTNYKREVVLFLAFTLFGLWVLQPIVIWLSDKALGAADIPQWALLTAAKIAATGVSLVWNYMTYSRFVFRPQGDAAQPTSKT